MAYRALLLSGISSVALATAASAQSSIDTTRSTVLPRPSSPTAGDKSFGDQTALPFPLLSSATGSLVDKGSSVLSGDANVVVGTTNEFRVITLDKGPPMGGDFGLMAYSSTDSEIGDTVLVKEAATETKQFYRAPVVWLGDGTATTIDLSSISPQYTADSIQVSTDGTTVIGNVRPNSFGNVMMSRTAVPVFFGPSTRAFKWTEAGGAMDLGTALEGDEGSAGANAVSADGSVIVGWTSSNSVGVDMYMSPVTTTASRWTAATGNQSLGTLRAGGGGRSEASAVSDDGSVIVGNSDFDIPESCTGACAGLSDQPRAFAWEDGVMRPLMGIDVSKSGFISRSSANAVSGDGSVIVGSSGYDPMDSRYLEYSVDLPQQAVIWQNRVLKPLGLLQENGTSSATDVSRDGSTVIGTASVEVGMLGTYEQAFRWTEADGMQGLGTLRADSAGRSQATALSADGSVIVGNTATDIKNYYEGSVKYYNQTRGFVWTQTTGMQEVGTLRDVDNFGASYVQGVSEDGTVIVGVSDTNDSRIGDSDIDEGGKRAFIMRLLPDETPSEEEEETAGTTTNGGTPPPSSGSQMGPMLDLQNTQQQIINNGQQQGQGVGQLSGNLQGATDGELTVESGGAGDSETRVSTQGRAPLRLPVAVNVTALRQNSGTGLSTNNLRAQGAIGVTNYLTFGGFVQVGQQAQGLDTFDFNGNIRSGGVYLRGGQKFGQGLTWKLSYGQLQGDATVTRDAGFANTEIGVGTSKIRASVVNAELGYGYSLGNTAMNSFVRLSQSSASRGAFTETAGATFPISYNAFEMEHRTLSLGTQARVKVSTKGALTLGITLEKDLSSSNNPLTGTSAIPGFTNFSVAGPTVVNDTRATVSASYEHVLKNGSSVVVGAYAGQSRYSTDMNTGMSVGFTARW